MFSKNKNKVDKETIMRSGGAKGHYEEVKEHLSGRPYKAGPECHFCHNSMTKKLGAWICTTKGCKAYGC